MATVLAKNTFQKGEADQSAVSLEGIPALGAPIEEKRFWFQRNKDFDPFAVATQVCGTLGLDAHFEKPLTLR